MRKSFLARENGFIHICGHRGHSDCAPENTIAAFKATRDHGGSSIEIDTVLTKDNEIVVIHDLLVDRTTNGVGAVSDMTLAEVGQLDAGAWFGAEFAGERISSFRDVIAAAHELDLVIEAEIKEKRDPDIYIEALKSVVADPRDLGRVMMISFDHKHLKEVKDAIPGIRTGGILHERLGDPVAAAKAANLDELCIDLSVFDPEDARRLHDEGIAIRCHAYKPASFEEAKRSGLNWKEDLSAWLREGLIDTLSGDDVAWLRDFRDAALR